MGESSSKVTEVESTFAILENEIGSMYRRKVGSRLAYAEESALSEISRRPEAASEWSELKVFALRKDSYFPKSMASLLAKWTETLDRARMYGGARAGSDHPKLSEIHAYANDKWGDDARRKNWAVSFHSYWNDPKRNWLKQGRAIEWPIEFTKQVAQWREAK